MAAVLITGGAGYLGRRVARRYLARTDREVILLVRKADERRADLERDLGSAPPRLRVVHGDVTGPDPFAGVRPDEVDVAIHAAADIRFNVDAATAQRVNVEGTEKFLAFAARCPRLERAGLVSTLYACGMHSGPIEEKRLDDAGFANHYERSKWLAEEILFSKYADLPYTVMRVATVIADDASGAVTQYNAVHNTFKLLFYGLISLLPGEPDTPMYFVTGDWSADAIFACMMNPGRGSIHHVCHDFSQAMTLQQMIDVCYERFSRDADFKAKRILPPMLVDQASFDELSGAVKSFSGEVVNQAFSSVAPFAKQLFVRKEVRNDRLAEVFPQARALDIRAVLERMADHLVATRWGRNKPKEVAANVVQ